jgi:hypothetical protein
MFDSSIDQYNLICQEENGGFFVGLIRSRTTRDMAVDDLASQAIAPNLESIAEPAPESLEADK